MTFLEFEVLIFGISAISIKLYQMFGMSNK
jgi:hypothetical protein